MTSSVNFTARLLNYVEPYYVDGVAKTAFYSEVNTNLKRNDKAFILNGFYDSEIYISKGKYAKNADGYKVLFVDRCRVVLDIDYSGLTQSYIDDEFDKFIKIYNIRSQREFDYINKLYVDTYDSSRVSKFEFGYTNNIIYAESAFTGYPSGIGSNSGLGLNKNFWAKSGQSWVNMTNQFVMNTFTFSQDYYDMGLTSNGRIFIMGEDIDFGETYKERNIYKFSDPNVPKSWKIDIDYKQPIITKLNFRQGIFRGIHNDGIFGSYLRSENWYATQSKWNSGFFVNSTWHSGNMKSKSDTSAASYYAILDKGVPVQSTDFSNNRGYGYNYILDSSIISGEIENGNFINCNIGRTGSGLTAIDEYVLDKNNTYPVKTLGGLYNYCDIFDSELDSSTTLDSIITNSFLYGTRAINSQLNESYSNGGEFSNDRGMKVISADMVSYIPGSNISVNSADIRGVIKLYISDEDYYRLDTFDNFYITKINKDYILSSLSFEQKIHIPYETRYVLDAFWDFKMSGDNQMCFTSLKTKFDNKSKVEVVLNSGTYENQFTTNTNNFASVDIDLEQYLAYYYDNASLSYVYLNSDVIIKSNNVQNLFLNTSLTNSDFRNGVIKNIKWTSGSNINYPSNIIKIENGKLKIFKSGANQIDVYLNEWRPTINDNQLRVGSYVWIDSIHHFDNDNVDTNLSGVYKIINVGSNELMNETILTITGDIVSSISFDGTYSVYDSLPTYASINKLIIDSSEINSGLFLRTLFKNSTFVNNDFNNLDRNLSISNIEKLRINSSIFADNYNTIKNGLVNKSHLLNANWVGGILNDSIWKGTTFGGGVFNSAYWESGTFQGGYFQDSNDYILTTPDYSGLQHYKNWYNGTFNDGFFFSSLWLNGVFNNGKFYNSDWYGGTWNNGILGDRNIPTLNTNMSKSRFPEDGIGATQTFWYGGIVENAQVGGDGIVYWYGGKFNNGVFISNGSSASMESIWYGGEFNGGDFGDLARWKNGTFNKGKFRSYYGWTMSSSTYSTNYSWENGKFNGGQFGVAGYGTNSTWYNGEFNGGIFQGRIWNNGIFLNGNFNGGSTYGVINDESIFTNSFTQSYYGLWRNGWVTNVKHKAVTEELISDNNLRSIQQESQKSVSMKDSLWINGVFDHPSGIIENSAWLAGKFKKGIFRNGVFNPYVKRDWWGITASGTYSSFNMSFVDCVWENGTFDNGTFYISDWYDGNFLNGTMSGGRWISGVWEYGYAKNIYWEDGLWKNGMWNGSPYDYNYLNTYREMIHSKDSDIILRVSNISSNKKIHIINAFKGTYEGEMIAKPVNFLGWTFSDTGNLSDWVRSNGTLRLNSGNPSSPQMIKYSSSGNQYTIKVGSSVTPGDVFKVNIAPLYMGTITVVAVSGDTPSTIAKKLSDKIVLGLTDNVVELMGLYTKWSDIGGDYSYPYSTNTPGSEYFDIYVRYVVYPYYTWQVSVLTVPVLVGSYTASETLYALIPPASQDIFSSADDHSISLTLTSENGRSDFLIMIGHDSYYRSLTDATATYNFNYTPPGGPPYYLGIKRVLYTNPQNSSLIFSDASVKKISAAYDNVHNNKLYTYTSDVTLSYGPTGSTVSLPPTLIKYTIADNNLVSVNFGNGVFKSGIWQSGYWNNGWRSTWDGSKGVIMFTDVVFGSAIETSANTWKLKLTAFSTTDGLSIGDKVSIGNIICKDVNENRRLIKDYFRIIDMDTATITVQVSINGSIRDIVRDSDLHMIYVSKNVWLSGVFHNGYFEGVWNYGLFKGYPYITVMNDSHWIDGVFDGGRFIGTQSQYISVGSTITYSTALIQNFIFRDNNVSTNAGSYLYTSWIDVNYSTYSMSNLYRDNVKYDSTYELNISDGNLRGYPTYDVLSSDSTFRNSYDMNNKSYKLGSKYKIYTDFIGDGSKFNYPLNTNGKPGVDEFVARGWTYTKTDLTSFTSNLNTLTENVLYLDYKVGNNRIDNVNTRDIEKFRYSLVEFNISNLTTTSTTTTSTTIGGGGPLPDVRYTVNMGEFPMMPGISGQTNLTISNVGSGGAYLYVKFTSQFEDTFPYDVNAINNCAKVDLTNYTIYMNGGTDFTISYPGQEVMTMDSGPGMAYYLPPSAITTVYLLKETLSGSMTIVYSSTLGGIFMPMLKA